MPRRLWLTEGRAEPYDVDPDGRIGARSTVRQRQVVTRAVAPTAAFTRPVDSAGQSLVVAEPNPPTLPSLTGRIGLDWCHILKKGVDTG